MCMMPAPKLQEPAPFVPPPAPLPPPPPSATATSVRPSSVPAPAVKPTKRKNPLRTDSGATDSVATGLNIPE